MRLSDGMNTYPKLHRLLVKKLRLNTEIKSSVLHNCLKLYELEEMRPKRS